MTALQWLLNNRGQSKLQLLYLTNSVTTMQIWLKLYFAEFYSNCDMPSIKFLISVPVSHQHFCLFHLMKMNPVVISEGIGWLFPCPSSQNNWLKLSYVDFQYEKKICVFCWMSTCTVVRTQACWGWAVADVWACTWRLSRCLLHARLYCEGKKNKVAWRGTHGLFKDYYSEEKYIETFHTSPEFLPLPFCPFFLT